MIFLLIVMTNQIMAAEEINVCLFSNDIKVKLPGDLGQGFCPKDHKLYQVSNFQEFKDVFIALNDDNKKIKKLLLMAHGKSGKLTFNIKDYQNEDNNFDATKIKELIPYRDVFSGQMEIDFGACELVKGCGGQLFLNIFARLLLNDKSGVLYATPDIEFHFPGGFRVGLTKFELQYSKEESTWTIVNLNGLFRFHGQPLLKNCSEEIDNLLAEKNLKPEATRKLNLFNSYFKSYLQNEESMDKMIYDAYRYEWSLFFKFPEFINEVHADQYTLN